MSHSDFAQPSMNCCAAANVAVGSIASFRPVSAPSGLPPGTDIGGACRHVANVPKAVF